jgi:hypothetical protein
VKDKKYTLNVECLGVDEIVKTAWKNNLNISFYIKGQATKEGYMSVVLQASYKDISTIAALISGRPFITIL